MNSIETSIVLISWRPNDYRRTIAEQSFRSLLACTDTRHLIVVVDNGPAEDGLFDDGRIGLLARPPVNLGVGSARNLGAGMTDSEFIAFVDDDLLYFPGWLDAAIDCLKRYPDHKLIACPRKSSPMRLAKHNVGSLEDYPLYNRASGQCMVMRRATFQQIGPWAEHSTPGGDYCDRARANGFLFIRRDEWLMRHIGRKPSYNYRLTLVDGQWLAKEKSPLQESNE